MNNARLRNHWNKVEAKYRERKANKVQKAFNVFTGYYKNNER